MELNPEDTKTPEITLFEIINDEKRKENHVADQFFRSLLEYNETFTICGSQMCQIFLN